MSHHSPIHILADLSALATIIGWFAGMLPAIAALFACVWYFIQIWESKTVKRLTGRDH